MGVQITSTTPSPLTGQGTVISLGITVNCTISGPVNTSLPATMNGTGWAVNFGSVQAGCYDFVANASDDSQTSTQIFVGGVPC
jgi:hypothetical protein